jgi:hypothetical protein
MKAFELAKLGEVVGKVISDEARFLVNYESNWKDVYGLPGRRESHLVAALSSHLRHVHKAPYVLDDSFWERPKTRCDLAVMVEPPPAERWVWIEVKTMPAADATDKLRSAHEDLMKFEDAAKAHKDNFPQALVVVGYDYGNGSLAGRIGRFAKAHGLDQWIHSGSDNGVSVIDLPRRSTKQEFYTHAVVGVWAREGLSAKIVDCEGQCHLAK